MSDSCQPQQRNLYQLRFAHLEYRNGLNTPYHEQLRQLSWPVPDDVPTHAQPSATTAMMAGKYDTLHPNASVVKNNDLSFMQTHSGRGKNSFAESDPMLPVHSRLFVPSKTVRTLPHPPPPTHSTSRPQPPGHRHRSLTHP